MTNSADVPLPGLDLGVESGQRVNVETSRPYDNELDPTPAAVDRFWSHVVKAPGRGCWVWVAAISSPDGYGRITWRSSGRSRTLSAHRFALVLEHGEAAAGAVAEHRCNEPLCVRTNDDHVILSTQSANLAYAVSCGRAIGNQPPVLADGRSRVQRSRDVRAAVVNGWNPAAYYRAAGLRPRPAEPVLF